MKVRVPRRRNPKGGFFDLWNFVQCLWCYRRTRVKTEDGMDVDGDETEDAGDTDVSSSAASSDAEMDSESGDTPTKDKKKKPKKLKPRKSELNMEALTNEQAALAALESNQILHLRLRKRYYAEGLNFIRQVEGAMWVSFLFILKKWGNGSFADVFGWW